MIKTVADYPELLNSWDFNKNTENPENVLAGSTKEYFWKCCDSGFDDHEWKICPNSRTSHYEKNRKVSGCPFCSRKKVCLSNCFSTTHPEIAKYWHPTKNGDLTPYDVLAGSKTKIWWMCCNGHEWLVSLTEIIHNKNICQICSPICREINLTNCLSIVHPEIAKYWHPTKNGDLTPYDVHYGSCKKYWFKCYNDNGFDDHEWFTSLNSIISSKKNSKNKNDCCPCCSGRKLVKSNCLAITHPDLIKQWHPIKNDITPYDVSAGSNKKVWWIDNLGHEWISVICARALLGSGCPFCSESKGEKRITEFLNKNNINFRSQKTFKSCKNKKSLPFDFVVLRNKRICFIEYQGEQHYNPVRRSSKVCPIKMFEELQKRDKIKKSWCEQQTLKNPNRILLEISYWDFDKIEEILTNFFNLNVIASIS